MTDSIPAESSAMPEKPIVEKPLVMPPIKIRLPGQRQVPSGSVKTRRLAAKLQLEDFAVRIRQRLHEFYTSYELKELVLEPMDREERRLTHEIAHEFELRTQSSGKEPNRKIRVLKQRFDRVVALTDSQILNLDDTQREAINSLLKENPIQLEELEDHLKADLRRPSIKKNASAEERTQPIIPPPPNSSPRLEAFREKLPTTRFKSKIMASIRKNKVTIITGGTGCGKTTQVPQFLLEEATQCREPLRIICTQPRRLPALAVAERVAHERGERLGDTVGYHIRLEQRTSANTALTYCTSGVLLRLLTVDDTAQNLTHIILDEVHEREQNTDYLLIVLREALSKRDNLKVILMSATMQGNKDMFLKYFSRHEIGYVEIPSRLHNVDKFYLHDVLALTGYMPRSSFGGFYSSMEPTDMSLSNGEDNSKQSTAESQLTSVKTVPDLHQYQNQHVMMQPMTTWTGPPTPSVIVPPNGQVFVPMTSGYEHMHRSTTVPTELNMHSNFGPTYYDNTPQYLYQSPYFGPQPVYPMMPVYPNCYDPSQMMHQSHMNQHPSLNGTNYQKYDRLFENGLFSQTMGSFPPAQITNGKTPATILQMAKQCLSRNIFGNKEWKRALDNFQSIFQAMLPNRPHSFDPSYISTLRRTSLPEKELIETYMELGGRQWMDTIDPLLTVEVIKFCVDSPVEGAILVFLPGYDDIMTIREKLLSIADQFNHELVIFTLHSQMNSNDQQRVFDLMRQGQRKIILSTNIAEASLTIDDVVFVVDCGKVKEKTYEHGSRISQLKVSWIAQSNADQRAGRAGRCRDGFCFRLYSTDEHGDMHPTQVAEMKRAAIYDVCLHAKMFAPNGMTVFRFLELAPEPPPAEAIDRSLEFLEQLGALFTLEKAMNPPVASTPRSALALTSGEKMNEPELTDFGRLVAQLPLEPQLARLLFFGLALKCFQPVVTLVAALSHRDPFILPLGEDRTAAITARDTFTRLDFSDHLMLIRAMSLYSTVANNPPRCAQFCRQNFLSQTAMKMIVGIRRQLFNELKRLHLIPHHLQSVDDYELNHFSHSWPMIQGAIVAGCYPGVAFVRSGSKLRKIRTGAGTLATLHPSSSLRRQVQAPGKRPDSLNKYAEHDEPNIELLVYQELTKIEEGLTIRIVTAVPHLAVALFAGPIRMSKVIVDEFELAEEDYQSELDDEQNGEPKKEDAPRYDREYYVALEPWLNFKGTFHTLQTVLRLRFRLMSYILSVLKDPLKSATNPPLDLLRCVADVLETDHRASEFNSCTDIYKQRPPPKYNPTSRLSNGSPRGPSSNVVNLPVRKSKSPKTPTPPDSEPPADPIPSTEMSRITIVDEDSVATKKSPPKPKSPKLEQQKTTIAEKIRISGLRHSSDSTKTRKDHSDVAKPRYENGNSFDRKEKYHQKEHKYNDKHKNKPQSFSVKNEPAAVVDDDSKKSTNEDKLAIETKPEKRTSYSKSEKSQNGHSHSSNKSRGKMSKPKSKDISTEEEKQRNTNEALCKIFNEAQSAQNGKHLPKMLTHDHVEAEMIKEDSDLKPKAQSSFDSAKQAKRTKDVYIPPPQRHSHDDSKKRRDSVEQPPARPVSATQKFSHPPKVYRSSRTFNRSNKNEADATNGSVPSPRRSFTTTEPVRKTGEQS